MAGFSWVADEPLTRTSHVLADGSRVWFIDPVRWPEAIERARALGSPVAVIKLLDRHRRDAATLAAEFGVPLFDVPVSLPDAPFDVVEVRRGRWWKEIALWWDEQRTLVVAEALGSNRFFAPPGSLLGVHALMRPCPPRRLGELAAEHVLVGHGEGLHGPDAHPAVLEALRRSRRDLPRILVRMLRRR